MESTPNPQFRGPPSPFFYRARVYAYVETFVHIYRFKAILGVYGCKTMVGVGKYTTRYKKAARMALKCVIWDIGIFDMLIYSLWNI